LLLLNQHKEYFYSFSPKVSPVQVFYLVDITGGLMKDKR
jgi:hypothetical protein